MRRELGLLDCFGLGVNGIVGSGIFLLPAVVFRRAGGMSPVAWLTVGLLCVLVALCFAEAAASTERSGGPYRYACDAFGPHVGFVVGWVTLTSSVLGYAAVSRGFAEHAAWLFGRGGLPALEAAIAAALIVVLAIISIFGIKPSARTSNVVGAVKIFALVAFVTVGLTRLHPGVFAAAPHPHAGEATGIAAASFAGLFALTGFEYVPVPAGETRDPRRAIGVAMVISVIGATVLYALIQIVTDGTVADLGESKTPVVDAAHAFAGPAFGSAMAAVALLSSFGFCAASALVGPRYVESLAQDRFLPALLEGRSRRFNTPVAAIVASSALVIALAMSLDFTSLADTSVIAIVVQYVATCASVVVARRRDPHSTGFRVPFGYLVPAVAIVGSVLFLFSVAASELWLAAGLLGGGLVFGVATRRLRRPAGPSDA